MINKSSAALGAVLLLAACAQTPTSMPATTPGSGGPSTLNVADAAIAGGDPSMALSVSQHALETDPNNVDALIHEGEAYYALGRCPAAEAAFNLALKNDPKSSQAETGLGRCLIKTDPAAADRELVLAVQNDPGNAVAYNDLGIARDLEGNFAGAVEPYQKALSAHPGMTAAEINLGLSLALSGNGNQALQYLGPLATSQTATPKIREDYAVALVSIGEVAEARHVLSIDLPPNEIDSAIDGFNAIIANAQKPLPDSSTPAPPTQPQLQTSSVNATTLITSNTPAAAPSTLTSTSTPSSTQADNQAPQAAMTASTPAPATAPATATATTPTASPAEPSAGATKAATTTEAGAIPLVPAAQPTATSTPADTTQPESQPASPAVDQSTPAPTPASAPTTAAAAPSGMGYQVQLGAFPSYIAAQKRWDYISSDNVALFGDKTPTIENALVHGKTYYRLRTGNFSSKFDAGKFCAEVSAAGGVCTLANF